MDLIEFFSKEWGVIAQAPATFIIAGIFLTGAAYAAASWRFGGIIASQRAEIDLLARKVAAQPGGADFESRKAIIEDLGVFLARGTSLMTACRDESQPPPAADANSWIDELHTYLAKHLGTAYVARVEDGGSAPAGYSRSDRAEHDKAYNNIRVRVFHLQEFLKELARP